MNADDGNAGVPPAGAGASRPRYGTVRIRDRGRLPHWEVESGTYFVTFRLHDSIPSHVVAQMKERLTQLGVRDDRELTKKLNLQIDRYVDRGTGACYLRNPAVALIVHDSIQNLDGQMYRLMAWAVMPNHIHLVFRLLPGRTLAKATQSLKSFTSKRANTILGRSGVFWQREYYDRSPRNARELNRLYA
ncbi:MAG: transposase [Acidobacteriota bacterium]|nr:transposase [Acidobacteriota bacterium]